MLRMQSHIRVDNILVFEQNGFFAVLRIACFVQMATKGSTFGDISKCTLRVVLYLCVVTTDLHETLVVATRSCNASTMKRTVCFLSVAVLGICVRATSTFPIDEKSVSWAPRTLQPKHEFAGYRPLLCVVDPTSAAAYPNSNSHAHFVCAVDP